MRLLTDAPQPPITENVASNPFNPNQSQECKTQIQDNYLIANVQCINSNLPLIEVTIAKKQIPVLLDTGSSVSIISKIFFENIKEQIKARFLSRRVQITTINSSVNFSSCVEFTFKIQNQNFKHSFFVIDVQEDSSFKLILGYDFMRKHHIIINKDFLSCDIKGIVVPFLNTPVSKELNFMQKNGIQKEVNPNDFKAVLYQKVTIAPNDSVYVKTQTSITPASFDKVIFTSNLNKSGLLIHEALYDFDFKNDNNPNSPNRMQNSTQPVNFIFYVFIENLTNEPVHLNKNMQIGFLTPAHDIKKPFNNNNAEIFEVTEQESQENINAIVPSQDILNKRLKEFNEQDFKLEHLKQDQKDTLLKIFRNNFAAFSKSISTLGHTDRIIPSIKFNSDYPIRCLPFPVPQSLPGLEFQGGMAGFAPKI